MGQQAAEAAVELARKLAAVTEKTTQTLLQYQRDKEITQWKVIGVSALMTITTCLLALWLLIPKPTLPLSHLEMDYYLRVGKVTMSMWPKLSKSEKDRWIDLSLKVPHYNALGISTEVAH